MERWRCLDPVIARRAQPAGVGWGPVGLRHGTERPGDPLGLWVAARWIAGQPTSCLRCPLRIFQQ